MNIFAVSAISFKRECFLRFLKDAEIDVEEGAPVGHFCKILMPRTTS